MLYYNFKKIKLRFLGTIIGTGVFSSPFIGPPHASLRLSITILGTVLVNLTLGRQHH